jgi:hypothetical protein
VAREFFCVGVDAFRASGERRPQYGQPFFESTTTPLQDSHPNFGIRAREESEVNAEALVIPSIGTSFGEQLLKALFPSAVNW